MTSTHADAPKAPRDDTRGVSPSPDRPIRVIQWYTGDIAQHQIRLIHEHPTMELVGAFVHHADKAGVDAGEIAGIGPIGVIATADRDRVLAMDAECVLYNPPMERYDEIIPMLRSGKNVISIIAGFHPHRRSAYPEIVKACEVGFSSLFGTGLNPGLSYELALLASSVCCDVEAITIRTCEPQATLSPVFLEMFGFGKAESELSAGASGVYAIFARTLHQITDLLCDELGLPADDTAFSYEFEPATVDYDDKIVVRAGTMAGLLLRASTTHQGTPAATIEVRFLLGPEYVRDTWLEDAPSLGWIEVDVQGTPGSRITHEIVEKHGFTSAWATGTKAVNSIPFVCAAPPGVLTPLDLPLAQMLPRHA